MARLHHYFHARPRLLVAVAAGVITYALLDFAINQDTLTSVLCGWNVTSWLYLAVQWFHMLQADAERIRRVARLQDESAATVLSILSLGSAASLIAIMLELSGVKDLTGMARVLHLALTGATLAGSWLLIATSFTNHYAHMYYGGDGEAPQRHLAFPDKIAEPKYWDFLYFAITISVASQTADIAVCSTRLRRVVIAHELLAFLFNLSILGLSINVGASLLS
ncbi:DUF1345 domain-containing protein [Silvimonas sp. JCM 19000]